MSGQHYRTGSQGSGGHSHSHSRSNSRAPQEGFIEVKSKFDAEFRRFSLDRSKYTTFEQFEQLLESIHLGGGNANRDGVTPFVISYTDPKDNDQLPINNTDNYLRALQASKPLLRLVVQRQGEFDDTLGGTLGGYGGLGVSGLHDRTNHNKSIFNSVLGGGTPKQPKTAISISRPSEFRQVRTHHRSTHT